MGCITINFRHYYQFETSKSKAWFQYMWHIMFQNPILLLCHREGPSTESRLQKLIWMKSFDYIEFFKKAGLCCHLKFAAKGHRGKNKGPVLAGQGPTGSWAHQTKHVVLTFDIRMFQKCVSGCSHRRRIGDILVVRIEFEGVRFDTAVKQHQKKCCCDGFFTKKGTFFNSKHSKRTKIKKNVKN